jgi:hypothetical protein
VATFDPDEAWDGSLGWRLLGNGCVTLFWQAPVLAETVGELRDGGYRVLSLDAGTWADEARMHEQLAAAFGFPDHYGENLDALNDCLRDVATYADGSARDAAGTVLVLDRFDTFARHEPDVAHALLDSFAATSRLGLLFGHRMMCLLRSDDPDLDLPPFGATHALWNDAEWLHTHRHPEQSD